MRRLLILVLAALPAAAHSQTPRRSLSGVVHDRTGSPVVGANVMLVGSTDGDVSDSIGRFAFATTASGTYKLLVSRIGFEDARYDIADSTSSNITLTLTPRAQAIAPVVARASRYAAGSAADATLTPLEIVTIPGTAADVNRAIQTLPGVQQVDEGTGLFVRGGDYTETRVFLNGGELLTPAQLENSAGTFVGTLDPFLLDAAVFTAGGFGPRYGDALSAIVELQTQGRPTQPSATISAGLAAIGASVAVAGPKHTGLRVTADHNDLTALVRLNGSPRAFTTPPIGDDRSVSAQWDYRPTAHVSVFATRQSSLTGAINSSPSVVDTFTTSSRDRAVVARWSDLFGSRLASVVVASSASDRSDDYGSFRLEAPARLTQAVGSLDSQLGAATVRTGLEVDWEGFGARGSVPATGADQSRAARTRLYDDTRNARRIAAFQDYEWRPTAAGRITAGLRYDRSGYSSHATLDPRVNAALQFKPHATLTAAWGYYHQDADPLLQMLRSETANPLPSMQARQAIVGVQLGDENGMLRIEAYDKAYAQLAGQTHDFVTVGGGRGRARGIDFLAHAPSIYGIDARVVYSFLRSRRTDPSTGLYAPATADIPHNLTVVATRAVWSGLTVGSTFRYASGRPFTPVVAAVREASDSSYTPSYGAPGSQRLPAYARVDLSANWYRAVKPVLQSVVYVAISNALDRANVFTRQYTADYSAHYDVRSVFNRSVYFGAVLTFGKSQ